MIQPYFLKKYLLPFIIYCVILYNYQSVSILHERSVGGGCRPLTRMNDKLRSALTAFDSHTELRLQQTKNRRVGVVGGNLVTNISANAGGVCARANCMGAWGFASAGSADDEAVKNVLLHARENAGLLNAKAPKQGKRLARCAPFSFTDPRTFKDTEQKTLTEFAMQLDGYISKTYPDLTSRSVSIAADCVTKELYTSEGSISYQLFPRTYVVVSMSVEAEDGTNMDLYDIFGGGEGWFSDYYDDPAALYEQIDALYTELMKKREGVFPEAGEQLCIIDSAISGMVAHEAVGHTTEADLVLAGSVAAGALGAQVASPLVNLTDFANTAFGKRAPLPVFVDEEGVECRDAVIIKDGILTGYMNNLEAAAHFDMAPTGNARAFAFSDEPLIRMRNTAIHPGKDRLEDMIASVDRGYYLTRTCNGQADTTGEFMFGITMGYEIRNGRLGSALRDTTISGVAFNMLKTVDMLSDTVCWDIAGYCGKKQYMTVSMGGPAIRCRVNIGGR